MGEGNHTPLSHLASSTHESAVDGQEAVKAASKYSLEHYGISFEVPSDWEVFREVRNVGGDAYRIEFTAPGFEDKSIPGVKEILSASITNREFEKAVNVMRRNVSNEVQRYFEIADREAVLRVGQHEFGGYLVVVLVDNDPNALQMVLRTKEEPYLSQLFEILNSLSFSE